MEINLSQLQVLSYQKALADLIVEEEHELWSLFSKREQLEELSQTIQLELLKNSVRLDRDHHQECYQAADTAARAIGLDVPVIVYQASSQGGQLNAALFFVEDCAHVVLFGQILQKLNQTELQALFGHELAHHLLWRLEGGRYYVIDRLLCANAECPSVEPVHIVSDERFRLCTEVFADRGSILAAGGVEPALNCLLKIHTEIDDPDPAAYLRQVEEVFSKESVSSKEETHPELFIRARAMQIWQDDPHNSDEQIIQILRGPLSLEQLDCLDQRRVEALTKKCISGILEPKWMRSDILMAHAKLFWEGLNEDLLQGEMNECVDELKNAGPKMQDYWIYLCLDFSSADQDLEDLPLVHCLQFSEKLGIREQFEEKVNKELKVTKKRLNELWSNREELISKVVDDINGQKAEHD